MLTYNYEDKNSHITAKHWSNVYPITHTHTFWEILFLCKGSLMNTLNKEQQEMHKYDVALIQPTSIHKMKPLTGTMPRAARSTMLSISAACSSTVLRMVRHTCWRKGEAMRVRLPMASQRRAGSSTAWRMLANRMKRSGWRAFHSARAGLRRM